MGHAVVARLARSLSHIHKHGERILSCQPARVPVWADDAKRRAGERVVEDDDTHAGAPIAHLVPFYGFSPAAFATDHQTRQSGDFSHCNEHLLPDFLQIVRNNPG